MGILCECNRNMEDDMSDVHPTQEKLWKEPEQGMDYSPVTLASSSHKRHIKLVMTTTVTQTIYGICPAYAVASTHSMNENGPINPDIVRSSWNGNRLLILFLGVSSSTCYFVSRSFPPILLATLSRAQTVKIRRTFHYYNLLESRHALQQPTPLRREDPQKRKGLGLISLLGLWTWGIYLVPHREQIQQWKGRNRVLVDESCRFLKQCILLTSVSLSIEF